jgi:O-6-methylguanine DNA methyltransferase
LKSWETAEGELDEYFAGTRRDFDLPTYLPGTPFQQSVWQALRNIPFGSTVSYKELALWIGKPKSIRAVGQANGHNPISIIIPCHRVIGINGSLTGYGGGIQRKAALLDFEKMVLSSGPRKLADMPAYDPSTQRRS